MPQIAELILRARSEELRRAKTDLEGIRSGGAVAEQATKRVSAGFDKLSVGAAKAAAGVKATSDQMSASVTKAARATDTVAANMAGYGAAAKTATQSVAGMVTQLQEQVAGYEALKATLDPVFAASQRYENALDQINIALSDNLIRQSEANRMVDLAAQKYLGLESAAEQAARAEMEHAQELTRLTSGYESVRASVDPLFAASKQYEAALEQVNAAVQAGVVSQTQANSVMEMAAQRYLVAGDRLDAVAKTGGRFDIRGVSMQLSQVAQSAMATGNPLQALAIQLPDIGLAFGTVGIAAGVAAGVLLPVAANMFSMSGEADEAEDKIHALATALDGLASTSQASAEDINRYVTSTFSNLGDEVQALIDDLREAEFSVLSNQMRHEVEAVTTELTRLGGAFEVYWENFNNPGQIDQGYLEDINKIIAQSEVAYGEFLQLEEAVSSVFEARSVNEFIGSMATARDLAAEIGGPVGDSVAAALLQAADDAGLLERFLQAAASAAGTTGANLGIAAGEAGRLAQNLSAAAGALASVMGATANLNVGAIGLEAQNKALAAGNTLIQARTEGLIASKRAELESAFGSEDAIIRAQAEAQLESYTAAVMRSSAAQEENQKLIKATAEALGGGGGSGGGAAAATDKATKALTAEIAALEKAHDPMLAYNTEVARLNELLDAGLSEGAYQRAMADLNDELLNGIPIVGQLEDVMTGWLNGQIRGFGDVLDAFKNMLVEMVVSAAMNPIMIGIGLGGAGGYTAAKMAAGGGGMGANPLSLLGPANMLSGGGLMSGVGGMMMGSGSGFLTGLGGTLASGNVLGASFSALGSITSGALPAGAGIGAIGAALPAIGIVGAAVGFLVSGIIGKTKELDRGVRLTVDNLDLLVQSFQVVEKSRFWGLSKSVRTNLETIGGEAAEPFVRAVDEIQGSILTAADAIGVASSAFDGFYHSIDISTRGLSEEEAQAAVLEALGGMSDAMAEMAIAGHDVALEGETATQTLNRLATDLTVVNDAFRLIDGTLLDVSVSGAAAASEIAQFFGGAENFSAVFQGYLVGFYSEAERMEMQVGELEAAFAEMGLTMPQTRSGFRDMVEGIDLTTASGREMYAQLLSMSAAMDQVLPSISAFNEQMYGLISTTNTEIDAMISASRSAAQESARAAQEWYRTSREIRSFYAELGGTDLGGRNIFDQEAINRANYEAIYQQALNGSQDAARQFDDAARTYLQSAQATAGTPLEYQMIVAEVQSAAQLLAGVTRLEGARNDVMEDLYLQQIELLEDFKAFLALEGLTDEQIANLDENLQAFVQDFDGTVAMFEQALADLGASIEYVGGVTYAGLTERAEMTIDLIASNPSLPPAIQEVLTAAVDGVTISIDTILRQDLPPDILWLAVNAESQHLLTLTTIADPASDLTLPEIAEALATSGQVTRTIHVLLDAENLTHDELRMALASTAELARVINLAIAPGVDPEVRALALENVGAYLVNIQLGSLPDIPADIRKIVFEEGGVYALVIDTALTLEGLTDDERLLLLDAASIHVRTVQAVLAGNVDLDWLMSESSRMELLIDPTLVTTGLSEAEQKLLLQASSDALVTLTITVAYPELFDTEEALLLRGEAAAILYTTLAVVYPGVVTDIEAGLFNGEASTALFAALRLKYPDLNNVEAGLVRGSAASTLLASIYMLKGPNLSAFDKELLTGAASADLNALVTLSTDGWGRRFMTTLLDYSGTTKRRIDGLMRLSGLTEEQAGFLRAISGEHAGKVTLVGSTVLDPSTSFQQWYETETQDLIAEPMLNLMSSLDLLRASVDALSVHYQLAQLEAQLLAAHQSQQGVIERNAKLIADIEALEAATGVQILNGANDAVLRQTQAGNIYYRADGVTTHGTGDLDAFSAAYWAAGGYEDQIGSQNAEFQAMNQQMNALRRQITNLGGVPAYASGTDNHPGGLAYVHQDELIDMPAGSKVYSTGSTQSLLSDLSRMVVAQKVMNEELKALRSESRDLLARISLSGRRTSDNLDQLLVEYEELATRIAVATEATAENTGEIASDTGALRTDSETNTATLTAIKSDTQAIEIATEETAANTAP